MATFFWLLSCDEKKKVVTDNKSESIKVVESKPRTEKKPKLQASSHFKLPFRKKCGLAWEPIPRNSIPDSLKYFVPDASDLLFAGAYNLPENKIGIVVQMLADYYIPILIVTDGKKKELSRLQFFHGYCGSDIGVDSYESMQATVDGTKYTYNQYITSWKINPDISDNIPNTDTTTKTTIHYQVLASGKITPHNPDSLFSHIDSLAMLITSHCSGEVSKFIRVVPDEESNYGGATHGYFDGQRPVYLFSQLTGELGGSKMEAFFNSGELFKIVNTEFFFPKNEDGSYNDTITLIKAKEELYFTNKSIYASKLKYHEGDELNTLPSKEEDILEKIEGILSEMKDWM